MRLSWTALWFAFASSVGVAMSCAQQFPVDSMTETETGGCTPGTEDCRCDSENECEAGLVCAGSVCIADSAVTTNQPTTTSETGTDETTEGPGTDTGTATSTDSDTTTEPSECDPGEGVGANPDCSDPDAPYCSSSGVCTDCSGIASCGDVDAGTPACDETSGLCVECTPSDAAACEGTSPICDAATSACVPCTGHAQCESGACRLATGECFPVTNVLWVNKLAANCPEATGSLTKPFCEIQSAVNAVPENTTTLLRVLPPAPYQTQVQFIGTTVVAVFLDSGEQNNFTLMVADKSPIQLNAGAEVYLDGATIRGDSDLPDPGVFCKSADLWLSRSVVRNATGYGVEGEGCELDISRSAVFSNDGGGVSVSNGALRLANAMLTNNGGGSSPAGALFVDTATLDIVYSTLAFNVAFGSEAIECNGNSQGTAVNSVLFGQGKANSIDCPGLNVSNSAIDSSGGIEDGGDIKLYNPMNLNLNWFAGPAMGDLHLTASGANEFATVGEVMDGLPRVDYDGDPRPEDGLDFAGADRPMR